VRSAVTVHLTGGFAGEGSAGARHEICLARRGFGPLPPRLRRLALRDPLRSPPPSLRAGNDHVNDPTLQSWRSLAAESRLSDPSARIIARLPFSTRRRLSRLLSRAFGVADRLLDCSDASHHDRSNDLAINRAVLRPAGRIAGRRSARKALPSLPPVRPGRQEPSFSPQRCLLSSIEHFVSGFKATLGDKLAVQ
jgi:hypothetical protein